MNGRPLRDIKIQIIEPLALDPRQDVERANRGGDLPGTIAGAGYSVSGQAKIRLTGEQMNTEQQRLQKKLVGLSSQGEQVIVPGSTHLSILTEQEHAAQVVDAVRRMVERVRKENTCYRSSTRVLCKGSKWQPPDHYSSGLPF